MVPLKPEQDQVMYSASRKVYKVDRIMRFPDNTLSLMTA